MSLYSFGGSSGYPGLQDFFDQQNQYRPMAKRWGDEDAAANVNRLQGLNTAFGQQIGLNGQLGSKQLLRLAQAQDIYGGIGGGGSGSRSGGMSSGGLPPTEDIYQQRARISGLEAQTAAGNAERDRINREAYGVGTGLDQEKQREKQLNMLRMDAETDKLRKEMGLEAGINPLRQNTGEGSMESPIGPDITTAARAANAVNEKRIRDASYMNDPNYIAAGKAQLHKSTLTPVSMLGSVGQRWSNPDGGVTQSGGTRIQNSPSNSSNNSQSATMSQSVPQPPMNSGLPQVPTVDVPAASPVVASGIGPNGVSMPTKPALPATPGQPPATPGSTAITQPGATAVTPRQTNSALPTTPNVDPARVEEEKRRREQDQASLARTASRSVPVNQ